MKNLVPFMALLILGGSFSMGPALAKGKHCEKKCEKASASGDECCKDGDKSKTDKASADKGAAKEGEAKPADKK